MSDPAASAAVQPYLLLSAVLFCIGLYGVFSRLNAVGVLMSLELLLNACNINLIAFSRYCDRGVELARFGGTALGAQGQVLALLSITIAAAEAAVGLAIVISIYRSFRHINVDDLDLLRW
ncbi:MAG: NADH-quinone oxidoreductase subunit NuoK [Fimbriimonadaceae bacterium]|nr:NADH-quinone oxidoreductase subunit NuoK [Fimbriimonadaceae bacterium]